MSSPTLTMFDDEKLIAGGGSVVYKVALDDRWIGWVGDTRPWRGWRFGARAWWACWREDGDEHARWNSGFGDDAHKTRAAAVADLLAHVGGTAGTCEVVSS